MNSPDLPSYIPTTTRVNQGSGHSVVCDYHTVLCVIITQVNELVLWCDLFTL